MAGQCSGGKQVEGFTGLSLEYMRSPKFLQADGAYERIVWMPNSIKSSLEGFIPDDMFDKIATDEDATSVNDIKEFLKDKDHPILERIANLGTDDDDVDDEYSEDEDLVSQDETMGQEFVPVATAPEMAMPMSGGVKVIFKNAKIYAEKVIIKKK